jgi:hypothetical protein
MSDLKVQSRVTSFAPQFLVDDLKRSMNYYQKFGFTFGEPWDGFYAIGELDGLELHLKEAPKNNAERHHRREHEHLDAAAGVDGIERSMSNASRMAQTFSNRYARRRGGRRISTLKIRTATSLRSAAGPLECPEEIPMMRLKRSSGSYKGRCTIALESSVVLNGFRF